MRCAKSYPDFSETLHALQPAPGTAPCSLSTLFFIHFNCVLIYSDGFSFTCMIFAIETASENSNRGQIRHSHRTRHRMRKPRSPFLATRPPCAFAPARHSWRQSPRPSSPSNPFKRHRLELAGPEVLDVLEDAELAFEPVDRVIQSLRQQKGPRSPASASRARRRSSRPRPPWRTAPRSWRRTRRCHACTSRG